MPEPPADSSSTPQLTVPERLALVYQRLDEFAPAASADEAFQRLCDVLDAVEDEYSGVERNPNPGLKFDGRMYPPRSDFITRDADGGIHAMTKGNKIHAAADGTLSISSRRTDQEVYRRAGAGPDRGQGQQARSSAERRQQAARDAFKALQPPAGSSKSSTPTSSGAAKPPRRAPSPPQQQPRRDGPQRGR